MKEFIILLSFLSIPFSCHLGKSDLKECKLSIKPNLKGIYYYLGKDSVNSPRCDNIFFLIDVKLVNETDSTFSFLINDCSTTENVVVDTKDLIICINSCTRNGLRIIDLKPHQEFSVPVILKAKKEIDYKIKIGFILLSPKDIGADDFFLKLIYCVQNLKNVLWSNSFRIGLNYSFPYEIK
jgi:hypothetical protein